MTIIDSHVHYIDEYPLEYIETLLRRMDENGVDKCVLFGVQGDPICSDGGVWYAVNAHLDRFIPFACSVRCEYDRDADVFMNYAFKQPWKGVGEVYIDRTGEGSGTVYPMRNGDEAYYPHYCPADRHLNLVYGRIFAECGKHGFPVLVHCMDAPVMSELLALYPDTNFIWGHADFAPGENEALPLLDQHDNLYCDIGTMFRFCSKMLLSGEFSPDDQWLPNRFKAWQSAVSQHPSRMMWGTDIFVWSDLDQDAYRQSRDVFKLFCDPLSAESITNLAGKNLISILPK
ncbi:MAG: amidohydrolase family protein [Armatimonadota bacterium]